MLMLPVFFLSGKSDEFGRDKLQHGLFTCLCPISVRVFPAIYRLRKLLSGFRRLPEVPGRILKELR